MTQQVTGGLQEHPKEGGKVSTNMAAIPPTITGGQQIAQPLHLITSSAVVFAERNASLATRVSPSSISQP